MNNGEKNERFGQLSINIIHNLLSNEKEINKMARKSNGSEFNQMARKMKFEALLRPLMNVANSDYCIMYKHLAFESIRILISSSENLKVIIYILYYDLYLS